MTIIYSVEGQGQTNFSDAPDECPICKVKISPLFKYAKAAGKVFSADIVAVLQCTNSNCQEIFISYFSKTSLNIGLYKYDGYSQPVRSRKPHVEQSVINISPAFYEIYCQSHEAEEQRLNYICGVGYRKSIEFLIKDYASFKNPTAAEEIKRKFLGPCIKDYVTDQRVKAVAERATWLGNDETHYERRWIDKDFSDLKTLIRLTLHWIEMDILTAEALSSMP